jgi:hypothetical protein
MSHAELEKKLQKLQTKLSEGIFFYGFELYENTSSLF